MSGDMTAAEAFQLTLHRARRNGWTGSDPYDGLLSPLASPVMRLGALPRFAFSQTVLRFPSFRRMASPPPSVNPKALALFLGAVTRGRRLIGEVRAQEFANELLDEIEKRSVRVGSTLGWGYPFPWQSRSFWAPANTPNAVVTSMVGWHALECVSGFGETRATEMAFGAATFLASRLQTTREGEGGALSYTQADRTRVVNISALGARLLLRVALLNRDRNLEALGTKLLHFVLGAQRPDGSWPYAADPGGAWVDSFHTGYVIESLMQIRSMGFSVPIAVLNRGMAFYRRFFGEDGSARLWLRDSAPLDAHSAAQGLITFAALSSWEDATPSMQAQAGQVASSIADWSLRELWIPSEDHFAYQMRKGRRDEREFLRWVQAWMALAMATAGSLRSAKQPVPAAVGVA